MIMVNSTCVCVCMAAASLPPPHPCRARGVPDHETYSDEIRFINDETHHDVTHPVTRRFRLDYTEILKYNDSQVVVLFCVAVTCQ